MEGLKRGAAAIVGVAESDLGQVAEGMSPMDLVAQGTQRALADCGLTLKDVDGLFCATTQARGRMPTPSPAETMAVTAAAANAATEVKRRFIRSASRVKLSGRVRPPEGSLLWRRTVAQGSR